MVVGSWVYVKATAKFGDIEAYGYAREEETKKGMDAAQITGAASSYARKYALNGLLGIDDTEDPDSYDNSQYEDTAKKEDASDVGKSLAWLKEKHEKIPAQSLGNLEAMKATVINNLETKFKRHCPTEYSQFMTFLDSQIEDKRNKGEEQ